VSWDWRTGDVVPILETPAYRAIPSPRGDLVATVPPSRSLQSFNDRIDIWDLATGRRVATLTGITGGVAALAFSGDGSRLATGTLDGALQVWDPTSGQLQLVLRGHYNGVTSVAFSPDGSHLASVGGEGIVRVSTLDLDELVEIAEDELTRSLTDEECWQYLHQPRCD
jgi:WD40 repeat protein